MVYLLFFLLQLIILFLLSRQLSRSLSLIIYKITKNQELSLRIFHFIFLPGVIIHELAHLISAEVMFVKTHGLSFTPQRNGDQLTMGSVQIEKTDPIRRAIIGFAPVFVGFILISFFTYFFLSDNSFFNIYLSYFLIFLIVFEIGNTMFSSRRDLEGTLQLVIFISLVIGLLIILGFSFEPLFNVINSKSFEEIMLKGIKILIIPITIDLIIVLVSRFLFLRN